MDKKRGYGSGSEVLDRAFFLFRVSHSSMLSCFRPGPVFLPRCYRCILYLFFILCSRCLLSWLCGRKLSEDPKEYKRPCGRMKVRRKCWRFAGDEVRHCHVTFLLDLCGVAQLALAACARRQRRIPGRWPRPDAGVSGCIPHSLPGPQTPRPVARRRGRSSGCAGH